MTCSELEAEKARLQSEIVTANIEWQAAKTVADAAKNVLDGKTGQLVFVLMQIQMQGCA